jgi:predicted ATP-grasp superfamily ATP-dependent carboligase
MLNEPVNRCDVLVLDARLRQSLATVRSLGSRGIRVAVLESDTGYGIPAFSSRWCRYRFACPAEEGSQAYFDYLAQVLEATGARVVIASSDGTIELLRRHREQLEPRVALALAGEPALGIAIDKEQTLNIAARLGLSVPRGVPVSQAREARAALREVGLPAVVKPTRSWASNEYCASRLASRLVMTPGEAARAIDELTRFGGKVLVQQVVPGRCEAIAFFYARREILARFAYWARRADPPLGGTDVMAQSIAVPADTGDLAEHLIREIGLEGYALVEFRRDRSGRPYLMEINSRLTAGISHAVHAGIDFPYMLYRWAAGESIDAVQSYAPGKWMRYLSGDIATTAASIQQRGRPGVNPPARAMLEFITAFFVPAHYDYLDRRDPLPACRATAGWFRALPELVSRACLKHPPRQRQARREEVHAILSEANLTKQEDESEPATTRV